MSNREKVIGLLQETAEYFRECRSNASFASKAENHFWELQNAANEAVELLKEQELGHWIFLTDCSNSGVYCSECNTKVFDNYPFKKKFSYFCPHCGTRMEGEIERRSSGNERSNP